MDINQQKEQFSRAYVHAVSTVAGFTMYKNDVDDDSIDFGISAGGDHFRQRPRLEGQIKCTSRDLLREDGVHFPLVIKNYDDLREEDILVPRILIVLIVPNEIENWIELTSEQLIIRHCAYWLSLKRYPAVDNDNTKTIVVPIVNMFTPDAVIGIMKGIAEGTL